MTLIQCLIDNIILIMIKNVVSFGETTSKIMGIIFNDNPGVMITIDETISAIVSDNISFFQDVCKKQIFYYKH